MFDAMQLLAFAAAAALLVLVPGPNTIVIVAHSLNSGARAGVATVLGVETGTMFHTLAAALGLSAILSTSAFAFAIVKLVGAGYLAYLGVRMMVSHGGGLSADAGTQKRMGFAGAYWRGAATNILNPKVALFFLAFLPQFVRPERGHLVLQFVALGALLSLIGGAFGVMLSLTGGSVGARLANGFGGTWARRLTGGVLVGLGLRLALAERG